MESTAKKNYTLPIIMMVALLLHDIFRDGSTEPIRYQSLRTSSLPATSCRSWVTRLTFIAYAFMGIPAGMLLQKIGYKKTALLAIIVGFCGVGISYLSGVAGSYAVYLTGAFVSGFSMCMLNTVVNPM